MPKQPTVAKDLRDMLGSLLALRDYTVGKYGKDKDWADTFLEHRNAILGLPKFKEIGGIIDRMVPGYEKGYMKYALGKDEKSEPPAPRDDSLTQHFLTRAKYNKMGEAGQRELAEKIRADLKKYNKSIYEFIKEDIADDKKATDAIVARAKAHDIVADKAREVKHAREVAQRKSALVAKHQENVETGKAIPYQRVINFGTVHPTTGGGRR